MNIIGIRQEERRKKISQIVQTIKQANSENKLIDRNALIMTCCAEWGMSRRSVEEYIKIAEFLSKNE